MFVGRAGQKSLVTQHVGFIAMGLLKLTYKDKVI